MYDYKTLDTIADAYLPLLLIIFLIAISVRFFTKPAERIKVGKVLLYLFLMVVASYGLMFLDKSFQLWANVGLDYSTHTAVALSLVTALCILMKRYNLLFIATLLIYIVLVLYQEYHAIPDVVSTAAPVLLFGYIMYRRLFLIPSKVEIIKE
jgi:hypothetical protein